jgi:aminoglycoside 2''-phosphotransferase
MTAYDNYVRILTDRYPEFAVRSVRPLQQGWDSVTLLVNDEVVFRFARRPDVAVRLAREARLLPQLAPALPVAIPDIRYTCEDPAGGMRFVGYPLLAGESLSRKSVASDHKQDLAGQLAGFLAALHAFPVNRADGLGALGGGADEWRNAYVAFYGEIREVVLPLLSEAERAQVVHLWERYLDHSANFTFAPALIHRDLGADHILHDPTTGKLTGVVDWGDAWIGDPAHDFTGLYLDLGPDFARSVLARYPRTLDETAEQRIQFYAAIVPFHEIRFGQLESDESHIAAGLSALRRNLQAS